MENLKNIKIIKKSYDLDRQKFVYEIHKVNNLIARREATIQKITSYKKEYTNDDKIEKLHRIKSSIMTKIVSLDDKIKLMGHFEDKANATKALKMEKADQTSLDDLSSTMHLRGSHV
jgi:hypothetical protein